jgi:hypothetical protein
MKGKPHDCQSPNSQTRYRSGIMLLLALIFPFMKSVTLLHAQTEFHDVTLSGWVIDAATREPLVGANIFLAGTTRGDVTDEDGQYSIENVPLGVYELIASLMGYEAQRTVVKFSEAQNRRLDFALRPKVLQGEEVTVTGEIPKEWKNTITA